MAYFVDQHFENGTWTSLGLEKGEYENCTFTNVKLFEENLSGYEFSDCHFENCDLSLAKLHQTALKNVQFSSCKMLGLLFEKTSTFAFKVSFSECLLDNSSFYQKNLKKTMFDGCSLKNVDFTEANLTQAVFTTCNLQQATFQQTLLDKTDFSSAQHFQLALEANQVKNAIFPKTGLSGLLQHFSIKIVD